MLADVDVFHVFVVLKRFELMPAFAHTRYDDGCVFASGHTTFLHSLCAFCDRRMNQ